MSFKQNNPLSRKTSPINRDWIKGAIKRPGAFKKKAEEAGMSTKAFAEKVTSNKEDYDSRTGKQAELAETLMGMNRNESPANRHTDKHMKRQAKREAKKTKGDAQDIYYEMKSDKMEAEKKKGSPAKMSEKAAERKQRKGKGKITVKTGGDPDPKYVSNRRKKRADKANDGTLAGITKSQKIKEKGRKIKEKGLSRKSSDGKRGDLLSKTSSSVKNAFKKSLDIHPLNPKNIKKGVEGVKKVGKKVVKFAKEVKEGYKKSKNITGTGGPSRKNCKYKK